MWERETDFEELLALGIKKTTKSSIEEVVALAIDEEKWGYKHVVGLLKKAMAKGKKDRIKVLYIISSICRKSRSQLGAKDKYAQRFTPVLPSIAKLLAEAPAEDLAQADKVLQTWRRDAVFDSYALAEFEEILKKGRASTASKHEKRKAEKQQPSQGPPGTNGDMDIDFGIDFEDDSAPPLPVAPPPPPSRFASSFMSQEPTPAIVEQPTKKARGSRWGMPIPPAAQPQLSMPAPAPQVINSISQAPPVHPEPAHPKRDPLRGSAESASQQQASIAFTHPSSGRAPAQPPVSSSQPLERVNQEDAMKRVRELAAEFMARASKSAALEQQSDMEEVGAGVLPPPPPPPPPPRPPPAQWPAPSAASAPQAFQGITLAVQPNYLPPAPVPPPGPGPSAPIAGPRPPPGSPPRQSNSSQRTLPHPLPPQPPPTLPAYWPAAPHFQNAWTGTPSMDQHLSSGAPPGLNPPPPPPSPPPPPAPQPTPQFSTAPSAAPPFLPNGAGASESQGSKMQEHVVPAAPASPPTHAHIPAQEPAWVAANAAPKPALEPEPEATPAKNRGLHPSVAADQPPGTIPGLDSNTGRDDNASEEDWWTTVTSSLPNLDGLMSPR